MERSAGLYCPRLEHFDSVSPMDTAAESRIEVDVDLPFRDLFWAMVRISLSATRHLLVFLGLALAFCVLAELYQILPLPESQLAKDVAGTLWPLALGALFVIVFIPAIAAIRSRRVLRLEGNHGHRRYIFSPVGVSIQSPLASAEAKWPAYIRATETRSYFLLYSAPGFANVLPKRCFTNATEIAEFRGLVRQKIPKSTLRS
jgi:hypothetical protein